MQTADPGPDWTSRVIANIYPRSWRLTAATKSSVRRRAHEAHWSRLADAEIERILGVYRDRERAGYADGYAFVAIFKNSGRAAGASLRHPHAQVVALRAVPRSIAARLERLNAR